MANDSSYGSIFRFFFRFKMGSFLELQALKWHMLNIGIIRQPFHKFAMLQLLFYRLK